MDRRNLLWVDFLILGFLTPIVGIFNWTLKGNLKGWNVKSAPLPMLPSPSLRTLDQAAPLAWTHSPTMLARCKTGPDSTGSAGSDPRLPWSLLVPTLSPLGEITRAFVAVHSSIFWNFNYLNPTLVQTHGTTKNNSRNKQFINFNLCIIHKNVEKPHTVGPFPSWGTNLPFTPPLYVVPAF